MILAQSSLSVEYSKRLHCVLVSEFKSLRLSPALGKRKETLLGLKGEFQIAYLVLVVFIELFFWAHCVTAVAIDCAQGDWRERLLPTLETPQTACEKNKANPGDKQCYFPRFRLFPRA